MKPINIKPLLITLFIILIGNFTNAQKKDSLHLAKNHFISLDEAKKMTALYRQKKNMPLNAGQRAIAFPSNSETFDLAPFFSLLAQPGCKALRVYYGMSLDLRVHLIVVGVDANNQDLLVGTESIIERGVICPPICPDNTSVLAQ